MAMKGKLVTFHGAFATKAPAVKREREVGGFIRPYTLKGHQRYVVMTRNVSANPRRSPRPNVFPWWLVVGAGVLFFLTKSPTLSGAMVEAP